MASQSELRIGELEATVQAIEATLDNQLDNLRREIGEIRGSVIKIEERSRVTETGLALVTQSVERLERRLDELLTRRWELGKLLMAAVLGSIFTVAAGFAGRSLDRLVGSTSNQATPAPPSADRK